MKKFLLLFSVIGLISSTLANDYKESSKAIRIYSINENTISEIKSIENKETKIFILENSITQEDFTTICSKMKWITKLKIESNNTHIQDITEIRSLKNLISFEIQSLQSALQKPIDAIIFEKNTNLQELLLYNTPITNTDALKILTSLQKISLSSCAVSSLAFLEFTTEVTELNLDGNNHTFENYSALNTLQKLETLSIQTNSQATNENLGVLKNFSNLQSLNISGCEHITSLAYLSNNKALKDVTANNCIELTNIQDLAALPNLRNLSFESTPITNISSISNKKKLRDVTISKTKVTDISPLATCTALSILNISYTNITNIEALAQLEDLRKLDVSYTPISSSAQITKIQGLRYINISGTKITQFEGFENNKDIEDILFSNTTISDISPLYALRKISYLQIPSTISQTQIEAVKIRYQTIRIDIIE